MALIAFLSPLFLFNGKMIWHCIVSLDGTQQILKVLRRL